MQVGWSEDFWWCEKRSELAPGLIPNRPLTTNSSIISFPVWKGQPRTTSSFPNPLQAKHTVRRTGRKIIYEQYNISTEARRGLVHEGNRCATIRSRRQALRLPVVRARPLQSWKRAHFHDRIAYAGMCRVQSCRILREIAASPGRQRGLTSAGQARAGSPFCGVLDALGPPCLTANVRRLHTLWKSSITLR